MSSPEIHRESFWEAQPGRLNIEAQKSHPGKNSTTAVLEFNRSRPARTRFPVSLELYREHKRSSLFAGIESPFKDATAVKDEPKADSYSVEQPIRFMVASSAPVSDQIEETHLASSDVPADSLRGVIDFEAIRATNFLPPDCTIAVGPQYVVVAVNSSIEIYDKTGVRKHRETLTSWFYDVIYEAKIFDPKLIYDQQEGRWVLLAVALPSDDTKRQSFFLLSVSESSDPLGSWFNYSLDATIDSTTQTNNWADYPGIGVDSQALYLTANMFEFDGDFQYSKIRVIPKAGAYSGVLGNFFDLVKLQDADGQMSFSVQPCHTYGAPRVEYFINSPYPLDNTILDKLSLWSLTDPLGAPALKRRTVKSEKFAFPPDAKQKGSGVGIDTGDVRIMNAVFQGGSIWFALTTRHTWDEGLEDTSAIHWFQVNPTSGRVEQQSHYGNPDCYYYYPSIMSDVNGNVTLVFCRSSASEFPSICYAGRRSTDPLGYIGPSQLLQAGISSYVKYDGDYTNRWGDYNGISIDPVDWRTVWFYSEYAGPSNKWRTCVGASKF